MPYLGVPSTPTRAASGALDVAADHAGGGEEAAPRGHREVLVEVDIVALRQPVPIPGRDDRRLTTKRRRPTTSDND